MADFMPVTACNDPKLKNHQAVEDVIASYYFDPDFSVGVSFDHDTGEPYLFVYGYVWPECWKLPEGVSGADFNPYEGSTADNWQAELAVFEAPMSGGI